MTYRDHVEQVRAASSIEAVLATRFHIPVEHAMALCPFHADANPSMSVSNELYHCFACSASGDVFNLLQHLEHKTFPEAVSALAEALGIPPYRQSVADRLALELERQTGDVTEWAATYYTAKLTPEARDYLTDGRGLPASIIAQARCGWADGGLVAAVCAAGGDAQMLLNAGLARPDGRDWIWSRVTFPALEKGRAIFLSGRTMAKDFEPKYLHQKGRPAPLYNLDALAGAARVLVTEGQIDTLSLLAWGLQTVGLLGTPHAAHMAALRRVPEVLLCLDGDTAGRRAALKLAAALGPSRTKIIPLPDGEDPNDVYRTRSKDEFLAWVEAARDPVEFALQGLGDLAAGATATPYQTLFALLATCDPLERHAYFAGPIAAWAKGERRLIKALQEAYRAYEAGPQKCPSCGAPIGGR